MPKTPIQSRTLLYERLPITNTIRLLDWCLVDTALGPMMEQRQDLGRPNDTGKITHIDINDAGYTAIREIKEDELYSTFRQSGRRVSVDFNA